MSELKCYEDIKDFPHHLPSGEVDFQYVMFFLDTMEYHGTNKMEQYKHVYEHLLAHYHYPREI